MRRLFAIALPLCALATAAPAQEKVDPRLTVLEDFNRRVGDYVKLHKTVRSKIRG